MLSPRRISLVVGCASHLTACVYSCDVSKSSPGSRQWTCCAELVFSPKPLWAVGFPQPLRSVSSKPQSTRSGQTRGSFTRLRRKTHGSLCGCDVWGEWRGEGGGYACHLWICSPKVIFGPASSSLWTENLKPTDSWARVWRKQEKRESMKTRDRRKSS